MSLDYNKLSALIGLVAAFAAAVISTDIIALDPGLETALIALIAGAAGILFPKVSA